MRGKPKLAFVISNGDCSWHSPHFLFCATIIIGTLLLLYKLKQTLSKGEQNGIILPYYSLLCSWKTKTNAGKHYSDHHWK